MKGRYVYPAKSRVELIVQCCTTYNCNKSKLSTELEGNEVDMLRLQ